MWRERDLRQASYAALLDAMVALFESSLRAKATSPKRPKQKARATAGELLR
jgi:hypothetical protein